MLAQSMLAAGLLAAPLPNPNMQIGPSNYPANYLRDEKSAAAVIEIIVTPDGKVAKCRELKTFGDEKFSNELCKLQNSRAWRRALDENGQPIYGVVRTLFRMFVPGTQQGNYIAHLAQEPDVELTVNRLPTPIANYLDVRVSLKVDASGVVTNCEARAEPAISANYARIACVQAHQLKFDRVLVEGVALPGFVIEQKVRFMAENSAAATTR